MKSIDLLFTTLSLLSLVEGLHLVKRDNPAVLHAPIHRGPRTQAENVRLRHDARSTLQAPLKNTIQAYIIRLGVGSPPQEVGLHIDTGSSDLWVNVPTSPLCRRYDGLCNVLGTFDPTASSTYSVVNNNFNITYQDGSGAAGPYSKDTITVAGTTIRDLEFGVAKISSTTEGVLGIGYPLNEAGPADGTTRTYLNLPAKLASDGVINTNAYSLYLDDLTASTGSILFGGVNTSKYHGKLRTLPIVRVAGHYSQFIITLTSVHLAGPQIASKQLTSSEAAIPALLDSGTSLTYLPPHIANGIYATYGLSYDARAGAAPILCSASSRKDNVTFSFSGARIVVPFSELVVNLATRPSKICAFGIAPTTDSGGLPVLGDTFLRSAYVVYDLENNEISLAQTRFGGKGDATAKGGVVEITVGKGGVPDARPVAGVEKITSPGYGSSGLAANDAAGGVLMAGGGLGGVVVAALGAVVAGWVL